jgi:hypothetical protein
MSNGEAIQILKFDKVTKEIEILKENFKVFKNFPKPIIALSTVGTVRMGKSTFNNLLITDTSVDKNKAFKMSNSIEVCTLGVWVWSKPIQLPDKT